MGNTQRQTGEPTTAAGNFIVSLIVNLELFHYNIDHLVIAFFLGDDQLSGWNGFIDFTKIVDKAKVNHNMVLEVA